MGRSKSLVWNLGEGSPANGGLNSKAASAKQNPKSWLNLGGSRVGICTVGCVVEK